MGLHKPFDRPMFLRNGSVLTEGGSLDLSKGQLGFFDTESVGASGTVAVSSFKGFSKNHKFELRYRQSDKNHKLSGLNTRNKDLKAYSSHPFTVEDVVSIKVDTPKIFKATPDIVVAGYNGIDPETAIKFRVGESKNATIELSGKAIGMLGYPNAKVQIPVFFNGGSLYSDKCNPLDLCGTQGCKAIVKDAIERVKQFKLRGGVPVTDYMTITPIFSAKDAVEDEIEYKFYELSLCDTGDSLALADVRQQYPGKVVERVKREGVKSTYQLLQPSDDAAPSAFVTSIPAYIKGCAACDAGFAEVKGGLVYSFTIADKGEDKSNSLAAIPNLVTGSVKKLEGQDGAIGTYTALFEKPISSDDFTAALNNDETITIHFIGEAATICKNAETVETNWTAGSTLKLTKKEFTIDLPDTNCGKAERLEELKAAYPGIDIEVEGTKGGCMTRYKACVKTNLRSEDVCDPIFLDMYSAEAPSPYQGVLWQPVVVAEDNPKDCKCGFRVEGKILQVTPTECVINEIAYEEDPIKVRVAGGWIDDIAMGVGPINDDPIHVEYRSRATKRDKVGFNLIPYEKEGMAYFEGGIIGDRDNVEKFLRGIESNINYEAQYIDYAITLRRNLFSQGMAQRSEANNTFHIFVEVGRQEALENLLNSLAAQAGIEGVRAFGV